MGGGVSKDIEDQELRGPAPPLHTRVREGDSWGPSPKTAVGREAWEHWPHGRDGGGVWLSQRQDSGGEQGRKTQGRAGPGFHVHIKTPPSAHLLLPVVAWAGVSSTVDHPRVRSRPSALPRPGPCHSWLWGPAAPQDSKLHPWAPSIMTTKAHTSPLSLEGRTARFRPVAPNPSSLILMHNRPPLGHWVSGHLMEPAGDPLPTAAR